jgi:hypothetical protein
MVEIGQIFGDEVRVKVSFGERGAYEINFTTMLPAHLDSRQEIRELAIAEAKKEMQRVINGECLPLDEAIKGSGY